MKIGRASLLKTDKFVFVVTESGRFRTAWDFNTYSKFLNVDVNPDDLGVVTLEAILAGCYITNDKKLLTFLAPKNSMIRMSRWAAVTIKQYDYSSEDDLYSGMKLVNICVVGDKIEISPNYRKGNVWTSNGVPEENIELLPLEISPADLGESIIRAFCRSK